MQEVVAREVGRPQVGRVAEDAGGEGPQVVPGKVDLLQAPQVPEVEQSKFVKGLCTMSLTAAHYFINFITG